MNVRRRSQAADQPPVSMIHDGDGPHSQTRKLRQSCTVISAITILILVVFYSYWDGQSVSSFRSNTASYAEENGIEIRLNPSLHAGRRPTTLSYSWRITSEEDRPDGVRKQVYRVNDQFPGPVIEARPGDRIVVEIENALLDKNESVSIHWHGLTMYSQNDMDGAAGITQDAIEPGRSFTYDFKIADDQAGTFWYHAHSAVQRADGLFGGLVVHEPTTWLSRSTRTNDYLLMIGDWYHRSADDVLGWYLNADSFGMEPVPDSLLINGRGRFECSSALPARPLDCQVVSRHHTDFHFDVYNTTRLRIVNVGAYSALSLSARGARMQTLSLDGGNAVTSGVSDTFDNLLPGERVDLAVESWNANTAMLEISLPSSKFKYSNPALSSTHSFGVSLREYHASGYAGPSINDTSLNLDRVEAAYPSSSTISTADVTMVLYTMTEKLAHLDYVPHGNINRTIWSPQSPALRSLQRQDWNEQQFVPHVDYRKDKPLWVDLIVNNLDEEEHPFHLHGHDFYVMSRHGSTTSWGSWNPFEDIDPPGGEYSARPLKKDTVGIPRRGYAVLRFEANNPGIWMFHCHVLWHLAGGMAMSIEVS